jgi:hypothetical protein
MEFISKRVFGISSFQKWRTRRQNRSCLGVGTRGKGGRRVKICGRNTMHSCMKMEKWDQLKLFQSWGEGRDK